MNIDWLNRSAGSTVDCSPGIVDLKGYRGDTFVCTFRFQWVTDGYANGDPVPQTGTWLAQIRSAPEDPAVLDSFTVDTSRMDEGYVIIKLTADQTRTLPTRSVWDLQNINEHGTFTQVMGSLYFSGDTTR